MSLLWRRSDCLHQNFEKNQSKESSCGYLATLPDLVPFDVNQSILSCLPPLRKVFGNIDFLGAPKEMRSEEQLKVISEEYEDISFVILSDVWLDQPKVWMCSAYHIVVFVVSFVI